MARAGTPASRRLRGTISERRRVGERATAQATKIFAATKRRTRRAAPRPKTGPVPPRPLKAHHVAALPAAVRGRCLGCACALPRRGVQGSEKRRGERKGRLLRMGGPGRSRLLMQIIAVRKD